MDVASCRKHSFKDRTEILNMMTRLQGYNTKKKDFLGDLIWQEVAFNTTAYGTSKIAIASCCSKKDALVGKADPAKISNL